MKFIFRGHIVFEYLPNEEDRLKGYVEQHKIHDIIPAFDYCRMIPEDYKLLGQFFDKVYKHIQNENIVLKDIEVY
jgi:hypothetical protein